MGSADAFGFLITSVFQALGLDDTRLIVPIILVPVIIGIIFQGFAAEQVSMPNVDACNSSQCAYTVSMGVSTSADFAVVAAAGARIDSISTDCFRVAVAGQH